MFPSISWLPPGFSENIDKFIFISYIKCKYWKPAPKKHFVIHPFQIRRLSRPLLENVKKEAAFISWWLPLHWYYGTSEKHFLSGPQKVFHLLLVGRARLQATVSKNLKFYISNIIFSDKTKPMSRFITNKAVLSSLNYIYSKYFCCSNLE